jgi:putative peptidoglycan binding protein
MASPESSEPVGDGEYVVEQGECLSSIAYEKGFLMETLWNDPGNAKLKAGRNDPNVLLPGDRVHIPKKRIREESCAADSQHQFVLKGATEMLRIVLLDSDGNPRKSLPYVLKIKGGRTKSGCTNKNGLVEAPIPPNAREGELVINKGGAEEHYQLELGAIDPPSTVTGIQARLNHLGFSCGEVDGELGPRTAGAIRKFQKSHNLSVTGEMDDATRNALVSQHGF